MRYVVDTNLGSLKIEEAADGRIIAKRYDLTMHTARDLDGMLGWLKSHKGSKIRRIIPTE